MNGEIENVVHLLFQCCKIRPFISYFVEQCEIVCVSYAMDVKNWILGRVVENEQHVFNEI